MTGRAGYFTERGDTGMSVLTEPQVVIEHLRDAGKALSAAHQWAGEQEGDRSDLIGPVRDLIFGLNSSIDALVGAIDEGRFGRRNYASQHDWQERPYGPDKQWVCRKCQRSTYTLAREGMVRERKPTYYPAQCISGHGLTDTD